jgi:hypothetical protein
MTGVCGHHEAFQGRFQENQPTSRLTTEDAVAYWSFRRRPAPRSRWVGPSRPQSSPEWRPFAGGLSPRSVAYALSVIGALYGWLVQQRYVLAPLRRP